MKKLFLFISFLFSFFLSYGQPIVNRAGQANTVSDARWQAQYNMFAPRYADTTAANAQKGIDSCGAIIFTYSTNSFHYRGCSPKRWILISSGSGGSQSWNDVMTVSPDLLSSYTSDFNANTWQWHNARLRIYSDAGTTARLSITTASSALVGPTGLMGFSSSADSNYIVGNGLTTDTTNRVVMQNAVTGATSFMYASQFGGNQDLQSVTGFGDSTSLRIVSNDTIKSQNGFVHGALYVGDSAASGAVFLNFGTSITSIAPTTCITVAQSYTTLNASTYGAYMVNRGHPGTTLLQWSAGDSSAIDMLPTYPYYNAGYRGIFFEYGTNEGSPSFYGHPFDTTAFKDGYARIIDTLVARGWPLNKIFIISAAYCTKSTYPNVGAYATAAMTIAQVKGVIGINTFTYNQTHGGQETLCVDSIHPSAYGHFQMNQATSHTIPATYLNKAGYLQVNGGANLKDSVNIGDSLSIKSNATTPTFMYKPYVLKSWGDALVAGKLTVGGLLSDLDNSIIQVRSSAFQVGMSVWNGGTNYLRAYPEYLQSTDATGSTRYGPSYIAMNPAGYFEFTGSGGLSAAKFIVGGIVFNDDNYTQNFQIKTDTRDNTFFINGTTQNVGINEGSPDSLLTITGGGLWAKRGVRFSGLPSLPGTKAVRIDANGTLSVWDTTSAGSSSLFPLTGTGTATGSVVGDLAGNDLTINNINELVINDITGTDTRLYISNSATEIYSPDGSSGSINLSNGSINFSSGSSVVNIYPDSISFVQTSGIYRFRYLPYANPDTSVIKVRGINADGEEVYTNWAYAGGGGGSPAGNQGNIQIKNGSSFGTPASDSLTFTSTGLKVTGGINFGGVTSSFPRLVDNGVNLSLLLADGSAYTSLIASGVISGAATFNLATATATTINIGNANGAVINYGAGTSGAETRWLEPSGSGTNYTSFKAGAQAANASYIWPLAQATGAQYLKNDGSGNLSWDSPAGAGTVTDFIFTDANGFDGTVSTSTSTPTLSLTTTVTNTQLMYSNSGAIAGISGATSNGTAVTFSSANLLATRPRITTSIDDANGNESLILTATGSAVNEITIANAATTAAPSITSSGETNVGLTIATKGTGDMKFFTNSLERLSLLGSPISGKMKIMLGGTSAYLDYGVDAANTLTYNGSSMSIVTSGAIYMSSIQATAAFYNGTATFGSLSAGSSTLNTKSFTTAYRATATSVSANATDYTIVVTATGQTITLPTAASITGRIYTIKLTASGTGTVATTSSQTIDGSTTYSLSAQYKYVTVQSDGSNWNIIANN